MTPGFRVFAGFLIAGPAAGAFDATDVVERWFDIGAASSATILLVTAFIVDWLKR